MNSEDKFKFSVGQKHTFQMFYAPNWITVEMEVTDVREGCVYLKRMDSGPAQTGAGMSIKHILLTEEGHETTQLMICEPAYGRDTLDTK